jgi:hypothetical protein
VTLRTAGGNPISGKAVSLGQATGHSTITAVNGITNASGQAVFTVTDSTVETVTYTATDTSDSVTVTQTAQVSFTTAPPTITSLNPPGPVNASVTISGSGFGSPQGSSTVTFAGGGGFGYSRSISIDPTKCGGADSASFPVLVSASDTSLKDATHGGHVQRSNGSDILFYADAAGTIQLPSEIESYDSVQGVLVAWVQVQTVSHTRNPAFYMMYGDSAPPARTANPWDSHFRGVWHLGSSFTDSTGNGQNGSATGTGLSSVPGLIGSGLQSNGATGSGSVNAPASVYGGGGPTTISLWIKTTGLNSSAQSPYLNKLDWVNSTGYALLDNGQYSSTEILYLGETGYQFATRAQVNDGAWHYVAATFASGAGNLRIYFDGALALSGATPGLVADTTDPLLIGQFQGSGGAGNSDEARVSDTVRSAAWILTEYNNQKSPGNIGAPGFLTWGSELPTNSGGVPATATNWTPTSITATVPSGATTGNVVVTVGGVQAVGPIFTVQPIIVPFLTITSMHTGHFLQGQNSATYTVMVSNSAGGAATNSAVTVTETVPTGMTLVSMAGAGWTCTTLPTCTRSDALAGGGSYPAITVRVNVAANAGTPLSNQVSVSGGGAASASGSDPTTVDVIFVSGSNSTVTASSVSPAADGATTATITVTLKDGSGNPVSGKTVALSQGTAHSTISAASGASNASGVVMFTVKDTMLETVTYAATDSTDGIAITQTAVVTFVAGPPTGNSTISANPTSVGQPPTPNGFTGRDVGQAMSNVIQFPVNESKSPKFAHTWQILGFSNVNFFATPAH